MKLGGIYRKLKGWLKEIYNNIITYKENLETTAKIPTGSIVLWGIPEHGNLGDQAITYAEINFIKTFLPEINIFTISEKQCMEFLYPMRKLAKNKKFLFICHGGGNMGELYTFQERLRLKLVQNIKTNPIYIFPQSIDYIDGSKALKKAKKIYESNSNVKIYAREQVSYEKMKRFFPTSSIALAPDIVTSINAAKIKYNREGIIFCVRSDKEANRDSKKNLEITKSYFENYDIQYIDTYGSQFVNSYESQKEVIEKFWRKIASSKLVVTDRLHGMIFSLITDTPCIAFDNSTGKVSAFYKTWLKKSEIVFLFENNYEDMRKFIQSSIAEGISRSHTSLEENFAPLREDLIQTVQSYK